MLTLRHRSLFIRTIFRHGDAHGECTRFDTAEHHLGRLELPVPFAIAVGIHDLIRIGHGPYGGGLSIDGSFRHVNDEVAFFIHAFRGKRDFKIRQDATVRVRSQQRIPDYPTLSGGDAVAVAAQRGRGNIQRFAAGAKRNGHIPHFAVRLGKNVVDVDLCVPRPLLTDQNAFELDGLNRKRHDERRHCDSNQSMHMLTPLFDD